MATRSVSPSYFSRSIDCAWTALDRSPSGEYQVSPVQRTITGTLELSLQDEIRIVRDQLRTTGERTARTLVKHGPLRTTLVGLAPGGTLASHKADGPITVQVLEGTVEFEADGQRWTLYTGSLLALESGITHSVSAPEGGVFLLTVASIEARGADSRG
jgi:quercetin dioxygenase-like cupin family protein